MATPRHKIVDPEVPGLYHCVSRCVRRAFLVGAEHENRRDWIEKRFELLCSIFAVDGASHSVMDNHLHVLVRVDPPRVKQWSDEEVVRRWGRLHPRSVHERAGLPLKRGATAPDELPDEVVAALVKNRRCVKAYRRRLGSLSWFMKSLKEPLARMANEEDGVTGAFWEGRFSSPRILDAAGLLTCMVYVDLNPIRAGLAVSLEDSPYTSVRLRIQALQQLLKSEAVRRELPAEDIEQLWNVLEDEERAALAESTWLAPIGGRGVEGRAPLLGIDVRSYLEIAEAVGRAPVPSKRGMIPPQVRSVLEGLHIEVERWLKVVRSPAKLSGTAIGTAASLAKEATRRGMKRVVAALDVCVPPSLAGG